MKYFLIKKIPDEINYRSDGSQFKAPDHEVLDGKLRIERKSRNAIDDSQFYYKLESIAKSQGVTIRGYGEINSDEIFRNLPDPQEANRLFTDYVLNQMFKNLRKADRKFEVYGENANSSGCLNVTIISDNTSMKSGTFPEEYFIARKMGMKPGHTDDLENTDAVLYIKHPKYVFDESNSYWLSV